MTITYRDLKTYKYQIVADYIIDIHEETGIDIGTDEAVIQGDGYTYITLSAPGKLKVFAGYSWDGPSGPTFDTKNFMRGSLVHDALYQLIRRGICSKDKRKIFDEVLYVICRNDGMSSIRARIDWFGLRLFGGSAVTAKKYEKQEVFYSAP